MLIILRASRFFGSSCAVKLASLESFAWPNNYLAGWNLRVFLVLSGMYEICHWYIRRHEKSVAICRIKKQA
ncbi:hypothetical protein N7533_011427 [Penicillium manginii]|uniref:uncharacterized protein n=1 Tax=Penicillium manginii TaxID=203109 RepID=UPI002547D8AA|nr:uncharacterized protein N7533_011427 [Penicillium manginii]KAJ5742018.1 hypothetical protein N7533_011427 [Penicillium manginii]